MYNAEKPQWTSHKEFSGLDIRKKIFDLIDGDYDNYLKQKCWNDCAIKSYRCDSFVEIPSKVNKLRIANKDSRRLDIKSKY